VPEDDKTVAEIQPEEDLFSLAERRTLNDELDVDELDLESDEG
jgi:hypothetical protein